MRRHSGTRYGTRSEYVYEALTLLYPAQFRREYGEEMVRAFGDLCRDRRNYRALASLWLWALADLFRGVFIERGRMSELSMPLRLGGLFALVGGGVMMISALPQLLWTTGWLRSDFTQAAAVPAGVMDSIGRLVLFGLVVGLYLHLRPRLSNRWNRAAVCAVALGAFGVLGLVTTTFIVLTFSVDTLFELVGTNFYYVFVAPAIFLSWSLAFFIIAIATLKAASPGFWRWLPLLASILFSPFIANRVAPIASYATGYAWAFNSVQFVLPLVGAVLSLLVGYAILSGRLIQGGPARVN